MLIATDPLSLVFVACFLVGILFLLATALLGNLGHAHIGSHTVSQHGGVPGHGAHVGSYGAAQTGQAANTHQTGNTSGQGSSSAILSYINPTSLVLFLLGFGFFGYVFHNTAHLALSLTLMLSSVGGFLIAALMLILLSRIFGDSEGATIQDVSDRTGMFGTVSNTIPENSLGEILYISPGGMRKSIPARSADGRRLERGQEVVVINYQRGVAEVDTWERFINEEEDTQAEVLASHEDELAKLRALLEESDRTNTELAIRKDVQKE
ncbi:MAG: hypothetical protein NVS4B7_11180 [Ktedonobacteraceae bacterium]